MGAPFTACWLSFNLVNSKDAAVLVSSPCLGPAAEPFHQALQPGRLPGLRPLSFQGGLLEWMPVQILQHPNTRQQTV